MIGRVKEGGLLCLEGGSSRGMSTLLSISLPFLGKGESVIERFWLLHQYFGCPSFWVLKTMLL